MIEDIEDNSQDHFEQNVSTSKTFQPHLQIISSRTKKPFIQANEEANSSPQHVK